MQALDGAQGGPSRATGSSAERATGSTTEATEVIELSQGVSEIELPQGEPFSPLVWD